MQYACTYILIPEITILGYSDHKTGITIDRRVSRVQYSGLRELNGHPPEFNIQLWYTHWTPSRCGFSSNEEISQIRLISTNSGALHCSSLFYHINMYINVILDVLASTLSNFYYKPRETVLEMNAIWSGSVLETASSRFLHHYGSVKKA